MVRLAHQATERELVLSQVNTNIGGVFQATLRFVMKQMGGGFVPTSTACGEVLSLGADGGNCWLYKAAGPISALRSP